MQEKERNYPYIPQGVQKIELNDQQIDEIISSQLMDLELDEAIAASLQEQEEKSQYSLNNNDNNKENIEKQQELEDRVEEQDEILQREGKP